MALADIVRFGTAGGIACMFAAGNRSLPLLCALVAATGSAAGSLFQPAMTALKPMLVTGRAAPVGERDAEHPEDRLPPCSARSPAA